MSEPAHADVLGMPDYGDMRTAIRAFNERARTLERRPTPAGCCPAANRRRTGEFRCTECADHRAR